MSDTVQQSPKQLSVYALISAVQKDLSEVGISKGQTNTFQKYKFRGIDDIYNTLSPILAKRGLVILPRTVERVVVEHESKNGGLTFYVTLRVEYDFVSSFDNSSHTVVTYGEAMDSSDKATNKAMSAAYKYAVIQAFAIPTEGDNDADSSTPELKAPARRTLAPDPLKRPPASSAPPPFLDDGPPPYEDHPPAPPAAKSGSVFNPRDYVVKFGKFSGKRLGSINPADVANYVDYLRQGAERSGEPLSGQAKEFVQMVEAIK